MLSYLRLRVKLPSRGLMSGTWVHIGYLQSWRKEMGSALLTCEPPCSCSSGGPPKGGGNAAPSPPLRLEGHNPAEKVSVTKIAPVHVSSSSSAGDGGDEKEHSCVLRVEVKGGGRFMLSHLITGSRDPGPLTWAFDVAGSLLLQ